MTQTYWVETLGCPKNQVDSDKLVGKLVADGYVAAADASQADLVVVNTCAFIEEARQESIDTVLSLAEDKAADARVVVTGCMAERYGAELAEALPEVDTVAGFGRDFVDQPSGGASTVEKRSLIPVSSAPLPEFDLLNLPRPAATAPWAYVKIAEGCDRNCGFCAIPSFRGPQRSRTIDSIVAEVDQLDVREVVLIAQDLAAYGRDQGQGERSIVPLIEAVAKRVDWVRLLYLYPSDLNEALIDAMLAARVPYFDLSLQHVSRPLLRRMRRWGDGEQFLERIDRIRSLEPAAAFRSNFIVGYPGETEDDHDALLRFVEAAQLDWCGFFAFSDEEGTYAHTLDGHVDTSLMNDRLAELRELQDEITAARRDDLIGTEITVLVDEPGVARSFREAPEIDGIVEVPAGLAVGEFHRVTVVSASGPDLVAE
ncbi:MAG: 30S ribosomal protein S12 methylthiotransferase RimO [Actinobacteria bacterium]|nr:30S ribosomal protein S12 methylthiotransferase RimO [Actinomycetota bacterium]